MPALPLLSLSLSLSRRLLHDEAVAVVHLRDRFAFHHRGDELACPLRPVRRKMHVERGGHRRVERKADGRTGGRLDGLDLDEPLPRPGVALDATVREHHAEDDGDRADAVWNDLPVERDRRAGGDAIVRDGEMQPRFLGQ